MLDQRFKFDMVAVLDLLKISIGSDLYVVAQKFFFLLFLKKRQIGNPSVRNTVVRVVCPLHTTFTTLFEIDMQIVVH